MKTPVTPSKIERRAGPRRIYHGAIEILLANQQVVAGRGIDVSTHGVGLHCPRNLQTGTPCTLNFALLLSDGSIARVSLSGVVTNSALSGEYGGFRLGIQLNSPSASNREILLKYMAARI